MGHLSNLPMRHEQFVFLHAQDCCIAGVDAMRSIPNRLLIHTVSYHTQPQSDRWGVESVDAGITLQRVRLEPSKKIVRDINNAEIQLSATMFYDCKNSYPRGIEFHVDDLINFDGKQYSIKIIEPLYDEDRLHHYELGLIRHA
nr:MAG TPA: Minor capsid protein [Caudoviricetes sp.]DAP77544.1 MAG TPA: Minor capsid protein [Caudoviricetes sp.]